MAKARISKAGALCMAVMAGWTIQSSVCRADIVGGDEVMSTDDIADMTVALYRRTPQGGALCTATLITKNIALTAAHCVEHGVSRMAVVLGGEISSRGRKLLRVVDAEIAREWNETRLDGADAGDIALVRFEGALPKGYHPAHPLHEKMELRKGDEVVLAGYGITNALRKTGSGTLRKATVNVAQPEFGKTEILLDQRRGSGACHGDSGGPAFVESGGKLYLMGVTSRGYPLTAPDDCRHKVVYTRVNAYRDWIKDAVNTLSSR